jgi:hypothetical protein
MAKKAAKKTRARSGQGLSSHPATRAMMSRMSKCNKPPVKYIRMSDGSWLECFLMSDCTYANCEPVRASQVPAAIRKGR